MIFPIQALIGGTISSFGSYITRAVVKIACTAGYEINLPSGNIIFSDAFTCALGEICGVPATKVSELLDDDGSVGTAHGVIVCHRTRVEFRLDKFSHGFQASKYSRYHNDCNGN